ncbi:microtubule associated protein [Mycena floridula]|nr:microtubule associated protein [Mycena floridula]
MSSSSLLTSLLNTLHSHLQSQTQLLPTLHAQLGLPATALEDELEVLKQKLMQSVESQIDSRRKEVDAWMEKCELVEVDCVRYSKALGGNVKATGTTVGELRKQQVLPRRFEMVSEYQEKLRQLYHTKLEQLTTLSNRLNVLSRTLGSDFYARDIVEPTPASDGPQDSSAHHRDVTPERFSKLEKELVRGKAEVTKRLSQLSATFIQIDWLYTELGIIPPSIEDLSSISSSLSLPSSSHRPSSALGSSYNEAFTNSNPAEEASESTYQYTFAKFVARVEEADNEALSETQLVPIGLEGVEPTQGLLQWADNTRISLEDTKRRREAHIQAMYDQLEGLWRRLGVDDASMDAFVEAHRGSNQETIREYEEELERMMDLKREKMGAFVASAREEIVRLWDDLLVGEEERADFAPFADDEHTEELLTIHEDEIRRLKDERRMKAPLLAGIKKYFEICEEEMELAAAASDQTRLLGRGSRDPGRLLREEKMRKRVSKEKPRLEQDLLASIPAWEREADRQFLVHGESILALLLQAVGAADQENKRKPARAGSVPPRATTPVNHGYAPMKGVVTPAVRPASTFSNAHSAPNKRMKVEAPIPTRAPLGAHRASNAARPASPPKIKPLRSGGPSSLPRPIAIPMPKPGTQHHALGHGRVPSSGVVHGANGFAASGIRSASSVATLNSSVGYSHGKYVSGDHGVARKASRARRESFKPRPSIDPADIPLGGMRWGGLAVSVKEEDEDY